MGSVSLNNFHGLGDIRTVPAIGIWSWSDEGRWTVAESGRPAKRGLGGEAGWVASYLKDSHTPRFRRFPRG